jgi:hypothetical protein
MVEVERGSFFMVGSMVRTERGLVPLPAHWFYALARSVWVDHLPRGRLGVVAGARLGPLVAGAGAGARGRVIGSPGCLRLFGSLPIWRMPLSTSMRVWLTGRGALMSR